MRPVIISATVAETNTPGKEQSESSSPPVTGESRKKRSPIRWITFFVLLMCSLFFVWHIYADRLVPYTDQARIHGVVFPIVPRVSGHLSAIDVGLHTITEKDSVMFVIDPRPFELAVKRAEVQVDLVMQKMGARTATVKSAAASLGVARAQLDRAERNYARIDKVMKENPGALSMADVDRAETTLAQAVERVASAEANLEKAEQELGDIGPENAEYRSAIVDLEQAELDLYYTNIVAPDIGVIESFNVDSGYYCQAGQPIATFVSSEDVWIQADFRENNISNLEIGDSVWYAFDVAPGQIFEGTIRSIGYGVSEGNTTNRGDLPSIQSSSGWLREPQRFPVMINVDDPEATGYLRIGGQVDVVAFTAHDHPILNTIGKWQIKLASWMSYVR